MGKSRRFYALWWLGETEPSVHCQERAYAGFHRRPEPPLAVFAAIALHFVYRVSLGYVAAARGAAGPRGPDRYVVARR